MTGRHSAIVGEEATTMPLDSYVTLGCSGLAVSPFCLGAMTFGDDWGWGSSVSDSQAILDRFVAAAGQLRRHRERPGAARRQPEGARGDPLR
jgi:hypothetical protein